jgi:VTC domain
MTHIREVRLHAHELKFVIGPELAPKIRRWARIHLDADTHGTGPFGDEYRTTSIYFDTDDYDVFHRRGSFGRSKYRIRRYGDEDAVFCERKMRQPAVLAKRRTRLPLVALEQLTAPAAAADWPGYWFHRRVTARRLRPVCQVAYSRMARGVIRNGEMVRLTLDGDVRALPAHEARFASDVGVPAMATVPAMPALSNRLILELKYRGAPPAIFRQLVEEFALTPQTASKYRLGLVAVGQVVAEEIRTGTGTDSFYA